ncbi:MAG: hypothetical protein OIN84_07075 [Candidatus Methanoperedens sp.]|uniref:hypothetical protein n=1 Tax=Candidatus Methanoperedens sp. BLZ2 TaxID=2035255 RepID=UPI0011435C7F|nr:hypothetical protein [Candidatus Methanoperedens sp. BLZ2]KAB2947108.1 MAG: hypothetical protein F9K14_05125 [Candidatus Methanoperedens sp.]MBZ0174205.1 hypothetical protein [Candidatus Methanoperedens nitroreducens]MCX9077723.1 hypothetical protein [Candidatus Methanoperedens sp.]
MAVSTGFVTGELTWAAPASCDDVDGVVAADDKVDAMGVVVVVVALAIVALKSTFGLSFKTCSKYG